MNQYIKLLAIGFSLVYLISCSQHEGEKISVTAELELPANTQVKLIHLDIDKATTIDSVLLVNDKEFSLTWNLEHPALFTLRLVGIQDIFMVIHPGDEIHLNIDNTISPIGYTVEGSTDSRLVNEIMTQHYRVRGDITQLSIDYENSKRNPETFSAQKVKFDSIYDNLIDDHKKNTTEFIRKNAESLACIFALYQDFGKQKSQPLFDKYADIDVFNLVDSCLSSRYPLTDAVIALNRDVTEIKEQIKHKEFAEQMVVPGKLAPEFEVITLDGQIISLSDFEAEPVVYLFFAVWNKASTEAVIEINQLISKYPYRKLKVIAISFDTSKEQLQKFIDDNQISIPIACDYKYWESDYVNQFGIQNIPDIILLDKNHIIYNRNIHTQELIQILSEWKNSDLL